MNDISLKIVESPKSQAGLVVSPTLTSGDNDVDPLAIGDEAGAIKDPLLDEAGADTTDGEKAGNSDANTKENNLSERQELCDKLNDLQSENNDDTLREVDSPSTLSFSDSIHSKGDDIVVQSIAVVESSPNVTPLLVDEVVKPAAATDVVKESPVTDHSRYQSKEASSVKEELLIRAVKKEVPSVDVEMNEVPPVEVKTELKVEPKPRLQPMNGDLTKEDQGTKRRTSQETETESPLKKLCQEVEKTFSQHDSMISDYIHTATKNNVDEIQRHTEQLLSEIQTLRELAQKKEHEWNNILHLKKVKEEILLRLLRRKQVLSFEKSAEVNGSERNDPYDYLNQAKNLAIDKSDEISGLSLKQPGSTVSPMIQAPVMPVVSHYNPMAGLPPPYDKAHLQSMPKPVFPQTMMMPGPLPGYPRDMSGLNGQLTSFGLPMGRQGPTKDVKSIIADYRQRNPDLAPRRGRRMKSILNPNIMNAPRPIAPKVDTLSNLNNLNMLFNNLDMNQKAMLERLQQMQGGGLPNGLSFKDVLVQFANMQQSNAGMMPNRPMEMPGRPDHHVRPEVRRRPDRTHEEPHVKQAERIASSSPRLPPPPPYPEISLLPVTTSQESSQQSSLLHGILTKQASPASQSYSPTLAKLLTSPERKQTGSAHAFGQAKSCGEITITPVQPSQASAPEAQPDKTEEVVQLDDEESPASEGEASRSPAGSGSGRLVIDEGGGESSAEAGGAVAIADAAEGEGEQEGGDGADTPLCQGCRRRDAQFVCAGCANQWYCSRDCQVAAWDDHSEMCSG